MTLNAAADHKSTRKDADSKAAPALLDKKSLAGCGSGAGGEVGWTGATDADYLSDCQSRL